MKVSELVEFLLKQDQDKNVTVWNCEYGCTDYVESVKIDTDGDVVLS